MFDHLYDLALDAPDTLPSEVLRRLYTRADRDGDDGRLERIGGRADLPVDVAARFTDRHDARTLRNWLSQAQQISGEVLDQIARREQRVTVLAEIAKRGELRAETARRLLAVSHPRVAYGLADNPAVPTDVKEACVPVLVDHLAAGAGGLPGPNDAARLIASNAALRSRALRCPTLPRELLTGRWALDPDMLVDASEVVTLTRHLLGGVTEGTKPNQRQSLLSRARGCVARLVEGTLDGEPSMRAGAATLLDAGLPLGEELERRLTAALELTAWTDDVTQLADRGDTQDIERLVALLRDAHGTEHLPDEVRVGLLSNPATPAYLVTDRSVCAHDTSELVAAARTLLDRGGREMVVALLAYTSLQHLCELVGVGDDADAGYGGAVAADLLVEALQVRLTVSAGTRVHDLPGATLVVLAAELGLLEDVPMVIARAVTLAWNPSAGRGRGGHTPDAAAKMLTFLLPYTATDAGSLLVGGLWESAPGTLGDLRVTCELLAEAA